MRSIVNGLLLLLLLAPLATAQDKNQKAKPIDLSITAVGRQHHPIQTKSKEAQELFRPGHHSDLRLQSRRSSAIVSTCGGT